RQRAAGLISRPCSRCRASLSLRSPCAPATAVGRRRAIPEHRPSGENPFDRFDVPDEGPPVEGPTPIEGPVPEGPTPIEGPVPEGPTPIEGPVPEGPTPIEGPVPE